MEIEQAQQLKADLENEIIKLIQKFEGETGLNVNSIFIDRDYYDLAGNGPESLVIGIDAGVMI